MMQYLLFAWIDHEKTGGMYDCIACFRAIGDDAAVLEADKAANRCHPFDNYQLVSVDAEEFRFIDFKPAFKPALQIDELRTMLGSLVEAL